MTRVQKKELNQILDKLDFKSQILYLIQHFPDNYPRMLKSRRALYEYIVQQTPLLSDERFNLATRCYWVVHDICDFPRCSNPECSTEGGKLFDCNVKFSKGYPSQCRECSNRLNSPRTLHAKQTCLERYGSCTNMGTEEFKRQAKESFMRHYGVDNNMKCKEGREELEKALLKKYGYKNALEVPEIRQRIHKKYMYEGIQFDSLPEIAFYVWLSDSKIEFEYQPSQCFEYCVDGVSKTYHPDFKIGNNFYELKGLQFFEDKDPSRRMINPYDRSQDEAYEAKHQCMLKNNVKILTDFSEYLSHLKTRYPGEKIKDFKKK